MSNKFQPLVRSTMPPVTEAEVAMLIKARPMLSPKGAREMLERDQASSSVWVNNHYQVTMHDGGGYWHLNIRRRDGKALYRDWRHFQAIKNQLVGPENEGIELYPAESRLVDTSNKYHLFVAKDPAFRFPVGWSQRDVIEDEQPPTAEGNGYAQRGRDA